MQKVIRQILATAQEFPIQEDLEDDNEDHEDEDLADQDIGIYDDDLRDQGNNEDHHAEDAAHDESTNPVNVVGPSSQPQAFYANPEAMLIRISLGGDTNKDFAAERSKYIQGVVSYIHENCDSSCGTSTFKRKTGTKRPSKGKEPENNPAPGFAPTPERQRLLKPTEGNINEGHN
jgi:hypothetical protein